MAEIKLTKNELKVQQQKLLQLERYLPTLQLKKALLQAEVGYNKLNKDSLEKEFQDREQQLKEAACLIALEPFFPFEKYLAVSLKEIQSENIAGAELPVFKKLLFQEVPIPLFDTPPWIDCFIDMMRQAKVKYVSLEVAKARLTILERELNDVATRVNLFEKVLIPRCRENIKKIKIFLGDMQLAAVSQAKVAKAKILERKSKK